MTIGSRIRDRERKLRRTRFALAATLLLCAPAAARPEDDLSATAAPPASASTTSEAITEQRRRTQAELARISGDIALSQDAVSRLDALVAEVAADRSRLQGELIRAAADQKQASAEVTASETRIRALADEEGGLKGSLRERRGVLAEVLAALQRMGRKPPPALLVKPGDALGSVRSAILLGAVVPEIRGETVALLADLQRLSDVRSSIEGEKDRFAAAVSRAREEEERLVRLLEEKDKIAAESRSRIGDEKRRAAELASQATSLEALIAELDAASRRAEEREAAERLEAARAEAEAAARLASTVPPTEPPETTAPAPSYDVAALRREMTELGPSAPFSTMKRSLVPPVAGGIERRFGDKDEMGRTVAGATFRARPGDVVTAPADAQVLYAGPFRSYGQLLILNAGDGYHIVLAGMGRIDAEVGQFVLSGEPLAMMGSTRVASASSAEMGDGGASLYVEFRKDGKPVDPAPWWADGSSGRTRNDT
ncbi:murein hydrolase activator EnvC family protein [Aureimonas jatrophae]|uniref:Septal ring factor EnvC, activator of murein hydrolases AmiA and AmiB n=1 Tax=Aureimonas jatrophae TaxID=1166073 RepID=A0A1H0C1F2_9HYPH|nr:peptidoglycan DD-metalloendopeptidase family protein [Aureimonas jatrophae]MBB3949024.1 septal ring factor EnvC (AmiA/AmiB activator) [Aureimonas jatrophae]SDN51662.1 Septal ring factor EnvC, activator of murein hydrolases AmiA and AmiB [Aureimonas jatrophae]